VKTFPDFNIQIPSGATGEIDVSCPFCTPDRKKKFLKDLSVNVEKGTWHCHHCGENGGLGRNNGHTASPIPKSESDFVKPKYQWPQELSERAFNYLTEDRGISEAVLEKNKIGYEQGWVLFPYVKSGEVVNIKYRNNEKQFRQCKNAEKTVYGYDDIAETTIITEGEIDKLSVETAGFENSISIPDGAPSPNTKNYSTKFSFLENCKNRFDEVKKFIIAVDNDAPGKTLENELSRRLGLYRCFRVEWPEGCKDANECLIKFGAAKIKEVIDSAKPYPVDGIYWVEDLDIEGLYKHGSKPGIEIGWVAIDRLYTISQDSGELHIVTGIPGHGKSEFIDAMIVRLAESEGWSFGIFSPENYPLQGHASKLIEKHIGLPFRDEFNRRMTEQQMMEGRQWLSEYFSFVFPKEDSLTVESILELAKVLVYRKGIKGLVIDPWNELDHARPQGLTETEYISQALTKIRRFARNHFVHVWLVAHPTKLQKDSSNKYPVPSPYDISGSAHWRNKADNCIAVWRDVSPKNKEYLVEIHIQKIKKKYLGKLGMGKLKYEYSTGRYFDA